MTTTATSSAPAAAAPAAAPAPAAPAKGAASTSAPAPSTTTAKAPARGLSSDQRSAILASMDKGQTAASAMAAVKAAPVADPAAAAQGKPAAKPSPEAKAKEGEGEKSPEAAHDDTPDKRAALVSAKRVLLRQGFDAEDIEAMPPAKQLAKAEKFARMQAEADKAFKALKGKDAPNTQNTAAEGDQTPAEGDTAARRSGGARKNDDGEAPGNPGQSADLDSILTDLVLDKDDSKAIRAYDRQLRATHAQALKAATTAHTAALQEHQELITHMVDAIQEERSLGARSALSSEFPGLSDDAAFAKVIKRLGKMDPQHEAVLGSTAGYRDLMREACYIEFGPQMKEQVRTELLASNAASRDGQPDGVGLRPATGALSAKDYKDRMLHLYDSTGGAGPEFERGKAALGKPTKR